MMCILTMQKENKDKEASSTSIQQRGARCSRQFPLNYSGRQWMGRNSNIKGVCREVKVEKGEY